MVHEKMPVREVACPYRGEDGQDKVGLSAVSLGITQPMAPMPPHPVSHSLGSTSPPGADHSCKDVIWYLQFLKAHPFVCLKRAYF